VRACPVIASPPLFTSLVNPSGAFASYRAPRYLPSQRLSGSLFPTQLRQAACRPTVVAGAVVARAVRRGDESEAVAAAPPLPSLPRHLRNPSPPLFPLRPTRTRSRCSMIRMVWKPRGLWGTSPRSGPIRYGGGCWCVWAGARLFQLLFPPFRS